MDYIIVVFLRKVTNLPISINRLFNASNSFETFLFPPRRYRLSLRSQGGNKILLLGRGVG